MQCANPGNKRSLEPDMEPWGCRAKRVCLETELHQTQSLMDTSDSLSASCQRQDPQVGEARPRPPLCCPRCLGGEPGHINHIMGH